MKNLLFALFISLIFISCKDSITEPNNSNQSNNFNDSLYSCQRIDFYSKYGWGATILSNNENSLTINTELLGKTDFIGNVSIDGDLLITGSYNLKINDIPEELLNKINQLENQIDSLTQKIKELENN